MVTLTSGARTPLNNPFTPGYGALPSVFAGRGPEFRDLEIMASRVAGGIYEQSRHVVGVRGIGKTAMLSEFAQWADAEGHLVVRLSVAPAMQVLPALAHGLGRMLSEHRSTAEKAAESTLRGLRMLAAFGLRYGGENWHLEHEGQRVQPLSGSGSGDPGTDLRELLLNVASVAASLDRAVIMLLDEVQSAPRDALGSLLYALQEAQGTVETRTDPDSGQPVRRSARIAAVLAGLPSLPAVMRQASATFMSRSKAVRLTPLSDAAVTEALPQFTQPLGVGWTADASAELVRATGGYPYFLHVFGYHAWNARTDALITEADVREGLVTSSAMVEAFYDERLQSLSDIQRRALVAIANLEPDERRTGRIASELGYDQASYVSSTLDRLLGHGLIGRTGHGHYDLLIPGLDTYLRGGD